jgi:hypothetical protein
MNEEELEEMADSVSQGLDEEILDNDELTTAEKIDVYEAVQSHCSMRIQMLTTGG